MNTIKKMLVRIASAGKGEDGSYTRECYSKKYFEAVGSVKKVMEELGMEVCEDGAGNIHGILPGSNPELKHLLMGSHLDTVPQGGLFDGAYGVAGALEVIRRIRENGYIPQHTLEIYGFNGEESNPLGGTFGKRAIAGLVDVKQPGLQKLWRNMAIHRMKFLHADGIFPMPGVIWSFILNREIIFSTTIQILEWSAESWGLSGIGLRPWEKATMQGLL